jgi:hypothetical protein
LLFLGSTLFSTSVIMVWKWGVLIRPWTCDQHFPSQRKHLWLKSFYSVYIPSPPLHSLLFCLFLAQPSTSMCTLEKICWFRYLFFYLNGILCSPKSQMCCRNKLLVVSFDPSFWPLWYYFGRCIEIWEI